MKLKKCEKGFNCGAGCISKQLNCRQNIGKGASSLETYAMYLARKANEPAISIASARNSLIEAAFRAEFKLETIALAEEASKHWANLLSGAKLATQISSLSVIEAIVDDRMRSQFETGTSGGLLNATERTNGEFRSLNVPKDIEPRLRPVYGYLADADGGVGYSADTLSSYGAHRLILKDSIKSRATYTPCDSLEQGLPGNQAINAKSHIPQLLTGYLELTGADVRFSYEFETMDDAEYAFVKGLNKALKAKTLSEFREAIDAGINVYTEAQIFDDVRAEHIEVIEFAEGSAPSKQLLAKLDAKNIKHSFSSRFI